MGKLIVLEGCDGVGKTKSAIRIAEKIGGVYYKTPPGSFMGIKDEIEANGNKNLRFLYYLLAVISAAEEIKKILKNSHVVCDRYIYSTIAYHRALGVIVPENTENLVPKPDYSFCLHASQKEIKRRLAERRKKGLLSKIDKDLKIQKKVFEEFKKFSL